MTRGPLQGLRILVTRPAAQAAELANAIRQKSGLPVCFPLLDIVPIDDLYPLRQAADRLADYSIIVFVSPNAVDFSLPVLLKERAWPTGTRAAAIGPGTQKSLLRWDIHDIIIPAQRFDSEALLDLPPFLHVKGQKILIARGNGGRELLTETLVRRGAAVDVLACYRRVAVTDAAGLRLALGETLHALTVSSSEGLRQLPALLETDEREPLFSLPVFVPHARIAETARTLGFSKIILTPPADAGIITGLCDYFNYHERSHERSD